MKVLFIGRFQPFHPGHAAVIEKLQEEGRDVVVAVRDTPLNEDNPYTLEQRFTLIKSKFANVEVIVIPDIEEVAYGRKPGWKFKEVRLDKETEKISGSKIMEERWKHRKS
jgi:cytidyltransferase-like protein